MSWRQTKRATSSPAIPAAKATASISTAGSLKMMRPAATVGANAIAVIRSFGREAGLNAAWSSQAAVLRSQATGRASTQGL